ncbi:hypothetical protein L596_013923 [Steinernema carpocapsae]|uniref:Uncharacterized protein n=1 Tax=Steinernema carpocapsae TaxID=34508 RepID=A0A4U5P303_STECR|nr:hypothetical protein L596_013923 [Steinernema carpocapsae]
MLSRVLLVAVLVAAVVASDRPSSSDKPEEECPSNYITGRYDTCNALCGDPVPYCMHVELPWLREACHCRADKEDHGGIFDRRDRSQMVFS